MATTLMAYVLPFVGAFVGRESTHLAPADNACAEGATESALKDVMHDGTGDPSIPTPFGRNGSSSCSCRLCGKEALVVTRGLSHVVDNPDAPLCFSSYTGTAAAFTHPQSSIDKTSVVTTEVTTQAKDKNECGKACNCPFTVFEQSEQYQFDQMSQCLTPDRNASSPKPSATMFLLGDSHALNLRGGLALAVRGRYQVVGYGLVGTGFVPSRDSMVTAGGGLGTRSRIDLWLRLTQHALATVAEHMRDGDVLTIAQFWYSMVPRPPHALTKCKGPEASDEAVTERAHLPAMADLFDREYVEKVVRPRNGKLLVVGDWSLHDTDDAASAWQCYSLKEGYVLQHTVLSELASRHGGVVKHVSLMGLFCDEGLVDLEELKRRAAQPVVVGQKFSDWLLDDFHDQDTYLRRERNASYGNVTRRLTAFASSAFANGTLHCRPQVPELGRSVQDYEGEFAESHFNAMGAVYAWPYLCEMLHETGLMA